MATAGDDGQPADDEPAADEPAADEPDEQPDDEPDEQPDDEPDAEEPDGEPDVVVVSHEDVPPPEPVTPPAARAVVPPSQWPSAPRVDLTKATPAEPDEPVVVTAAEPAAPAEPEKAAPDPPDEADDEADDAWADETIEPPTTVIRLRPTAELLRAHRRRERRRTLTFLGIFLGVIGMGLAAFTFFQGSWQWPFGGAQAASVCPTPTSTAVPAKDVTVRVYNASSRRGLARTVAAALQKRDYRVAEVGNDPLEARVVGQAVIRHGPSGLLAARTVAAQFEGRVALVPDDRVSSSVDLVLGARYTRMRSPQAAAKLLLGVPATVPPGCATGAPSSSRAPATSRPGTTKPATGPTKKPATASTTR